MNEFIREIMSMTRIFVLCILAYAWLSRPDLIDKLIEAIIESKYMVVIAIMLILVVICDTALRVYDCYLIIKKKIKVKT